MKRRYLCLIAALLLCSSLFAQKNNSQSPVVTQQGETTLNRDLPIYLIDPILQAPEGTEYADQVRAGFVYYFENGVVLNSYKDGLIGDYVVGDDGNIYLKQPFSSLDLNTYLMLEPVDDTTFVAHTPQCVYAENGEYMYATRLIYTQLNENSYTYALEETTPGNYNTDMVFIYKDGVLRQQNDNILTVYEEDYPYELLGATDAEGGWFGIGDGVIRFSTLDEGPVMLPAGVESTQVTMLYDVLNTILEVGVDHPAISEYAEDGNDIYLKMPYKYNNGGYWAKGTLDPASGTISFGKQYLGVDEEHLSHLWLMPAAYHDTIIIWDDDYHECYRIYDEVDEIVFNRNGEYIESEHSFSMLINASPTRLDVASSLSDPRTSLYKEGPATPIDPYFTGVCEYDGSWFGYFIFNTPNISTEGSYIETDSMYYNVFINGSTEPYVFTPEDYWALTEPIVDVPYSFDDDQDICFLGYSHKIYFYWFWQSIGIRSIYKYNGEVHYSNIVWHHHFPTGITENPTGSGSDSLEEVVAVEYYDLLGRKVLKPENGVYIKVMLKEDGTRKAKKELIMR